jgi:hypothetical protein
MDVNFWTHSHQSPAYLTIGEKVEMGEQSSEKKSKLMEN